MNNKEIEIPKLLDLTNKIWHPILGLVITVLLNTKYDIPLWYGVIFIIFYLFCFLIYHLVKAYNFIENLHKEFKDLKNKHKEISKQYEEISSCLDKEKFKTISLWDLANNIAYTTIKHDRVEKLKLYKEKIL